MKPFKRRGDSFHAGPVHRARPDSAQGYPSHPQHPASTEPSRQSVPNSNQQDPRNNDTRLFSSPRQENRHLSGMNRRRSEGPNAQSSSRIIQTQHNQQLLSMKSFPNLTNTDGDVVGNDSLVNPDSARDQKQLTKSSPNIIADVNIEQQNMDTKYGASVSRISDFNSRLHDYGNVCGRTYGVDTDSSHVISSRKNTRRSLPAHNLQRYQPDYENVSHLGTAPLQSEKISEIDDIDEVTGRDSNPHSPDEMDYDPFQGSGLPTRDPTSLKYIKVNQNHEKYPSWPVTKPNGASEQSQPINTRAQSMTDHTNTTKEFPRKQQLAYTPGLRPLAEKNSPTLSDRKSDDGKTRNSSDPGFKSEFVYGPYGRVQRRNAGKKEGRFDDFYNNSKPGYPPPNMDPDGHNFGDKEYNTPSPPERDNKSVSHAQLIQKLGSVEASQTSINKPHSGSTKFVPPSQFNSTTVLNARPSNLNVNPSNPHGPAFSKTDTSTSPLDKISPLATSSRLEGQIQQSKQSFHMQSRQDRGHHSPDASPNSPTSRAVTRSRPATQKEQQQSSTSIPKDRSSSHYGRSSHQRESEARNPLGSGDGNKTYVVKSTPYYNTSTQTESMPYAIKLSDPSSAATKQKNAEIQVGGFATQTSPTTPEEPKKRFEEKSIQARMSRDFENAQELSNKVFGSRGQNQNVFMYPNTSFTSRHMSPFKGIQSIQAKYASDELSDIGSKNENAKEQLPVFGDNASILRKLSEEFYGQKLGLMPEKRMSSSSSQESPRLDPGNLAPVRQPGMREAESYSSVVIHHDQKSGPFGRDDFGSISSIADSRFDSFSVMSDSSFICKNPDPVPQNARIHREPAFSSQKSKFYQHNEKLTSTNTAQGQSQEIKGQSVGTHLAKSESSQSRGKLHDQSVASSSGSDGSSFSSASKMSSKDHRSSHGTCSTGHVPPSSVSSPSTVVLDKQIDKLNSDKPSNDPLGSDSVFVADDEREDDHLEDYEFNRKPSMRKAYGIYDETERLISQSKSLNTGNSGSERQAADPVVHSTGSSQAISRAGRYSESVGLGKIQEECDSVNLGSDFDNTFPGFSDKRCTTHDETAGKKRETGKYPWQNEAWLKGNIEIPTGSNLKRTTSEQIVVSKQNTNIKLTSYEAETALIQRSHDLGLVKYSGTSAHDYENKIVSIASTDAAFTHSSIKSGSTASPRLEIEPKRRQQQEFSRMSEQNMSQLNSPNKSPKDSLYESIGGNPSSPESVADVIYKVNENIAKSAKRVDSIRRTSSSASRSSSDYIDMSRERNRKETDWSRLRSSGSLRYSPDHDRRSSRSSFASENLYEDISLFSPSTPRSSFAEYNDKMLDPGSSNSSMDSGLVASPAYQNFPYQRRRPPPPPPRTPSPEDKPPALPPRKYRDNQQSAVVDKSGGSSAPGTSQNSSSSMQVSRENIMNSIPLTRPQNEDKPVDTSKRDFRSLMTQWENNSPREDRYAAELRKQAKKFSSNQQQQQSNAMPAAYERTKTKISYSTTYRHEPMQPQEATSPVSSSSQPSLMSSISTTASSAFLPTAPPHPSLSQPSAGFQQSAFTNNNSPINTGSASKDSAFESRSSSTVSGGSIEHSVPAVASSVLLKAAETSTAGKTHVQDSRNRSGSEVLHSKSSTASSQGRADIGNTSHGRMSRERSSSEHDILSDRKQRFQPHYSQGGDATKDGASKYRTGRGGGDNPLQPSQPKSGQPVEIVTMAGAELPTHGLESLSRDVDAEETGGHQDTERFADESYIGHKNKSSRAIGTYKRSKSAAVMESSSSNNNCDAGTDNMSFQDSKLSQQTWNSESVLPLTDVDGDELLGAGNEDRKVGDRIGAASSYVSEAASTAPVRPARSSVHGRSNVGQISTSSACDSQNSNVSPVSSSVMVGTSFLTEQPRDSLRRTPYNQQKQGESCEERISNKTYQPASSNNISVGINSRNHNGDSNPTTFSSSQGGIANPRTVDHRLLSDIPPNPSTQRDYQRRESVPVRSPHFANNSDSKLDVPASSDGPRRRSDSNVNPPTRSDSISFEVSHSRQPSQEELECDEKAKQLAQELENKDRKLSEVLRLDANKKRMLYMDGLFSESVDLASPVDRASFSQERRFSVKTRGSHIDDESSVDKSEASKRSSLPKEYWMSPSKALLEMELRKNEETSKELTKDINDSSTLVRHKEELMEKLHKKLEVLKEEKVSLQQEISENNSLGKQICQFIDSKCQSLSEKDKFKAYIDDLEKIVRLLLNLSGQLARAENAVQSLSSHADAKVKKLTIDKREKLFAKHEEAKFLKEDIDKRSEQLSLMLRERLTEQEFSDYTHFIKMKSKLTIELQELDDKITLGEEQILELRKSIPNIGTS